MTGPSSAPAKILITEDDPSLLKALVKKFNNEGFQVFSANNGEEGLKTALEKQPDLILLDIVMPIMDGIAMLKLLRQNPWGAKVPVVMLTNLADASSIENAMLYKVEQFLVKSDWSLDDVVAKVREKLSIKA